MNLLKMFKEAGKYSKGTKVDFGEMLGISEERAVEIAELVANTYSEVLSSGASDVSVLERIADKLNSDEEAVFAFGIFNHMRGALLTIVDPSFKRMMHGYYFLAICGRRCLDDTENADGR